MNNPDIAKVEVSADGINWTELLDEQQRIKTLGELMSELDALRIMRHYGVDEAKRIYPKFTPETARAKEDIINEIRLLDSKKDIDLD